MILPGNTCVSAQTLFRQNIIILDSVDSTNQYARRLIDSGKTTDETVIITREQHSGKGSGNNRWESEPRKNLTFSILLKPVAITSEYTFNFNLLASLAIRDFIIEETGSSFLNRVTVKWPNDIYIDDKKTAGILIETIVSGNYIEYVIIGIGVNINQSVFTSDAPNPVSLKTILNRDLDLTKCFYSILDKFENRYKTLQNNTSDVLLPEYIRHLYLYQQQAIYKASGVEFCGRIIGIGDRGQLIIQKDNNEIKNYLFKEIELVRTPS